MNTRTAWILHMLIAAMEASSAVAFFDPNIQSGALKNQVIQIALQAILKGLHLWVASINSNTDPAGNHLLEISPERYVSAPPK